MVLLFITVSEPDDIVAVGYTVIRVYTDTASDGAFTTLDGTEPLVATTESYEYRDVDGTDATWYKTAYWGAVPGESDKSEARKGSTSAAYGTVLELRNRVGITGLTDDVELAALLDATTRAINRFTNRPDGYVAPPDATTRIYSGSGMAVQRIDEAAAITSVSVKESSTDSTYTLWGSGDWIPFSGDPEDPDFNNLPYQWLMIDPTGDETLFTSGKYAFRPGFRPTSKLRRRGVPTVQLVARFGYSLTIPDDIREACIMQAARWYKRLQSSMADSLASPDFGTLLFTLPLDPFVQQILVSGRYIRPAIGVG